MNLKGKILEVLYKPYSADVRGYIVRIADLIYVVINSRLPEPEAREVQATLEESAELFPHHSFILLQGNGRLYKSDNFKLTEMSDAS